MRATASLGFKLNLALLVFFLLLGGATSGLILYGFHRTQQDATERSSEALEQLGRLVLQGLVSEMSEAGGIQFEAIMEMGLRAARQIDLADTSRYPALDVSRLATSASGLRYDSDTARTSDLVLFGADPSNPAVLDDIAISTPLNDVFDVLMASFNGPLGGQDLDPTAMVFISKNRVTRYFPPIGIHTGLDPSVDVEPRMRQLGPEGNPGRKTVWTTPYADSASQSLIVTARSPVYRQGVFRGTMEVDLSISRLIEKFNSIKPTPGGFAFYMDSAGNAHGGAFEALSKELPTNPQLASIFDDMRRTKPSDDAIDVKTETVWIGGRQFFLAHAPLLILGGSFAVAIPVEEITGEAAAITAGIDQEGRRTLNTTLAAMGGLFVFGLASATYLNRRILLRPIEELVRGTRAVAAGNLETTITVTGDDELAVLAGSFNDMTAEIRERRDSLERQVEERTRELTALLHISREVASTLEIQPLLRLLVDRVGTVVDYWRARLFVLREDALYQVVYPAEDGTVGPSLERQPVYLRDLEPMWSELANGRPVIIDDVRGEGEMAAVWQRNTSERQGAVLATQSLLAVPLTLKDQTIGMLTLTHSESGYYRPEHAQLVMAIASQAAVAIENARLYEEAGKLAAVEERQRLARELHDSVSQALYGIALSATAAQTMLAQGESPAKKPVDYVMTLAQAAMAEMRALIFELRPESLEVEGLVAAINKQVAATAARHGIMVEASLCDEPDVPLAVKEVFYRVCQEALHNVVKHSGATLAMVQLEYQDGRLSLEITDKGAGFDATQAFPGHMGLISMPERAATIGAEYEISSAPGAGTTVRLAMRTDGA